MVPKPPKIQAKYVKLKKPEDVMAYVQRLINNIRRKDLELDPNYLGKIVYLLNTWTSAFKSHMEYTEVRKLREDIERLEERMKEERK
jgi:polyhydroxyalkanoate synthesis regulator phasin